MYRAAHAKCHIQFVQVMQSLDHLVTDIEHARGSAEREQCHGEALSDLQGMNDTSQDLTVGAMYMSGKRYAVDSALADITAQLSSQYDLHDTW